MHIYVYKSGELYDSRGSNVHFRLPGERKERERDRAKERDVRYSLERLFTVIYNYRRYLPVYPKYVCSVYCGIKARGPTGR